jgi:hypothetical protein
MTIKNNQLHSLWQVIQKSAWSIRHRLKRNTANQGRVLEHEEPNTSYKKKPELTIREQSNKKIGGKANS